MSFIIPPSSSRSHSTPTRKTYAYTRPAASSSHTSARSAPSASSSFFAAAGLPGLSGGTTRGSSSGGTSYYKRRPRSGYVARLVAKIRRLLADLWRYVRAHPVKVLLPIAMALVSGGALHNLARQFGVTLPEGLKQLLGAGDAARSVKGGYDAWYGSQEGPVGGGLGGLGGMMGGGGWVSSGLKVASAFM